MNSRHNWLTYLPFLPSFLPFFLFFLFGEGGAGGKGKGKRVSPPRGPPKKEESFAKKKNEIAKCNSYRANGRCCARNRNRDYGVTVSNGAQHGENCGYCFTGKEGWKGNGEWDVEEREGFPRCHFMNLILSILFLFLGGEGRGGGVAYVSVCMCMYVYYEFDSDSDSDSDSTR